LKNSKIDLLSLRKRRNVNEVALGEILEFSFRHVNFEMTITRFHRDYKYSI
jgi:hypothetical protein